MQISPPFTLENRCALDKEYHLENQKAPVLRLLTLYSVNLARFSMTKTASATSKSRSQQLCCFPDVTSDGGFSTPPPVTSLVPPWIADSVQPCVYSQYQCVDTTTVFSRIGSFINAVAMMLSAVHKHMHVLYFCFIVRFFLVDISKIKVHVGPT